MLSHKPLESHELQSWEDVNQYSAVAMPEISATVSPSSRMVAADLQAHDTPEYPDYSFLHLQGHETF